MKRWIAPVAAFLLASCYVRTRSGEAGSPRVCADPPPTRPISVAAEPDSETSLEVVAIRAGGGRLDDASLLVRRASPGDTLFDGVGSRTRLLGVAGDSIDILVRRIGFFRRSAVLRLSDRTKTIVTIPLDQTPSHWCGFGDVLLVPPADG
jgi:hypothetical protein